MSGTWLSGLGKGRGSPSALRRLWPKVRVVVMAGFIALIIGGKLALLARLLSGGQVFQIGVVVVAVMVLFYLIDCALQRLGLVDEDSPSEPSAGSQTVSLRQPPPIVAAPPPSELMAIPGSPTGGTIPGQVGATWRFENGYVWRPNDGEAA